jgi:hypothetical protein
VKVTTNEIFGYVGIVAYVFLVIISLCEIAMASWLLLQYRFHQNHPNGSALLAIRFLMYVSSPIHPQFRSRG